MDSVPTYTGTSRYLVKTLRSDPFDNCIQINYCESQLCNVDRYHHFACILFIVVN
jgi:hypothetical protein